MKKAVVMAIVVSLLAACAGSPVTSEIDSSHPKGAVEVQASKEAQSCESSQAPGCPGTGYWAPANR